MNSAPLRAVIDASVAVKIFVPETLSDQAQKIFARFASEDGAELVVPDFFFVECANVFWKWAQRSAYPGKDVHSHLQDLTSLGLSAIPAQILAEDALGIALEQRITTYDACYVAASKLTRFPLITADEKLVMKLKGSHDVQWLGDTQVITNK